jgi:hypothetical protein
MLGFFSTILKSDKLGYSMCRSRHISPVQEHIPGPPEHTPMQSWNSFPVQVRQHSRSGAKPISGQGTSGSWSIFPVQDYWNVLLFEENLAHGWSIYIPKLFYKQTAKTQCRKFETNIPRKGIVRPQFQFPHSCFCERFLYYHVRSAYYAAGKYVDRSQENM